MIGDIHLWTDGWMNQLLNQSIDPITNGWIDEAMMIMNELMKARRHGWIDA